MRLFLAAVIGIQLLFGSLCMTPIAHARIPTADHGKTYAHHQPQPVTHCPTCAWTTENNVHAGCPAGHCLSEAAKLDRSMTAFDRAPLAVPLSFAFAIVFPDTAHLRETADATGPPLPSPTQTIVLRL